MIAFTPRFYALALALLMVVDAAPIPRTSSTSTAPATSTMPVVKPEYINRLPVFVSRVNPKALPRALSSMTTASTSSSQAAKIAKATAAVQSQSAQIAKAAAAVQSQSTKIAKATAVAQMATTRPADSSRAQTPASSPTAQAIAVGIPPVNVAVDSINPLDVSVKLGARDPHHHHHHDDRHREKIVVNGDHDVVEARSPHHHHHDGHHHEEIIVNGDHDHVEARAPHHHHHEDEDHHREKVVVNGDHDHVVLGDGEHFDTRRTIWARDNAVPGTIQLVNGSSAAIASLVVDHSNASSPVLAASTHNSTQVRLVFVSPDDFSAPESQTTRSGVRVK